MVKLLITPQVLYFKSNLIIIIIIIIIIIGDILDEDEETDFGEFKIRKKRASPPRNPHFNDEFANFELFNLSLERDIAWVLLSAVENNILEEKVPGVCIEELKAVGSGLLFQKKRLTLKQYNVN